MALLKCRPGQIAGIAESAVSLIEVEEFRLTIAATGWQRVHLRIAVTADGEKVEPAIVIKVCEGRAPLYVRQRGQRDAGLVGDIGEIPVSVIAVEIVVFIGEIRGVNRGAPGVIVIANGDAHGGLFGTVFTDRRAGLESDLFEFSIAKILVEKAGSGIVGDVNIRAAGIIEIRPDNAHAVVTIGVAYACGFRNIGESSVAIIVEQSVTRAFEAARPALHVDAAVFAVGRGAEAGQIVEMEIDVVGNHEIEKTVAIVVAKSSASRPAAVGNAGFASDIGEGAVAIIFVKDVAAEASDVEIGPAVVVVVSHRAAHGKARSRQAGFGGDIGERAVVIIVVQSALARLSLDGHSDSGGIGEIDVEPAIAIVVKKNYAAAHGFHDVFLRRVGGVLKSDARFGGDVFELWYGACRAFDGFGVRRRRRLRVTALSASPARGEMEQQSEAKEHAKGSFSQRNSEGVVITDVPWDAARSTRDSLLSVPCKFAIRDRLPQCVIPCDKRLVVGSGRSRSAGARGQRPRDAPPLPERCRRRARACPIGSARFRFPDEWRLRNEKGRSLRLAWLAADRHSQGQFSRPDRRERASEQR